jgi:putative transposase
MRGRRKPSKNFENFRAVLRATKVDRLLLKTMATGAAEGAKYVRRQGPTPLANALRITRSTNICWQQADSLIKLANMKIYRGFPERLHHRVPHWVEPGALFHVRIALDREKEQKALTHPALAQAILDSARFYETKTRWHITLFLLMPDHLHAILSFARDQSMSEVIRDWKRFHARTNRVFCQEGYFDHRLRADEHGAQFTAHSEDELLRQNPEAAGLCASAQECAWVIDPFAEGGSACPQDDGM